MLRFYRKNQLVKILVNSEDLSENDSDKFRKYKHYTHKTPGVVDDETINNLRKFKFSILFRNCLFSGNYYCESKFSNSDLNQFVLLYEVNHFGNIVDFTGNFDVVKHHSSGGFATFYYDVKAP